MKKSKLFLLLLIFFILGIAVHSFFSIPFFFIYIFFLVDLAVLIISWRSGKLKIIALGGLFLFLGIFRYHLTLSQIDENKIQFYNGKQVAFIGTVEKESDIRIDHLNLTLVSEEIIRFGRENKKVKGKVLIKTQLYPEYQYGDKLKVICELKPPGKFDDFDYEKYLSRYNIYSTCYYPQIKLLSRGEGNSVYSVILSLKNKLRQTINLGMTEPSASILSAIILGSRKGISQELIDKFSQTGISHIMAISGLHITIISSILMAFLIGIGLSRNKAFYFASLFLVLYIIMIGVPASAVRAGIMGFLVLLSLKLGRLNQVIIILLLAACLMLLVNPKILKGDISFQLSFLAVLGLIFISPLFEKWLTKLPKNLGIKTSFQMTFSAQLSTLPLIVFSFQRLSFIAPLANILILPILPFIIITGFLASLLSLVLVPLIKIIFLPVWLLLSYLIKVTEILANLPFSFVEVKNLSVIFLVLSYLLMSWGIYTLRLKNQRISKTNSL